VSPLFELGQVVATPGALEACSPALMQKYLSRHMTGDWGCVCKDDKRTNDVAVAAGFRVVSAYPIDPEKPSEGFGENTLWIITEADRSVTTFLLPEDY